MRARTLRHLAYEARAMIRVLLLAPLAVLLATLLPVEQVQTPPPTLHRSVPDTVWTWPEQPENLQVLPRTTGADGLSAVMREFTYALGVRCEHCHVSNGSRDFLDWDFAADDVPAKQVAREMMRMVQAVNGSHLAGIEPLEAPRLEVTCVTCHRGQRRPQDVRDLLAAAYAAGGIDSVAARYRAWHAAADDGFGLDLRVTTLGRYARTLDDPEEELALLRLATELAPSSADAWVALAGRYEALGRTEEALAAVEQALDAAPGHRWATQLKARLTTRR